MTQPALPDTNSFESYPGQPWRHKNHPRGYCIPYIDYEILLAYALAKCADEDKIFTMNNVMRAGMELGMGVASPIIFRNTIQREINK